MEYSKIAKPYVALAPASAEAALDDDVEVELVGVRQQMILWHDHAEPLIELAFRMPSGEAATLRTNDWAMVNDIAVGGVAEALDRAPARGRLRRTRPLVRLA